MSELPECMIGPSEPCDAFTKLQDERDCLRAELAKVTADHKAMVEYALKLDASNDDYQAELAIKDARICDCGTFSGSHCRPAFCIEALRKELAEARQELDEREAVFVGDGKTIGALRKELAETKSQLGSARKQLETIWAVVSGLNPAREGEVPRKELAEAKAVIANLGELWEERWRNAERLCDQRGAALEAAKARIAELAEQLQECWQRNLKLSNTTIARAERAEARIAEFADKGTLQALRDANDRMERAEAECKAAKELVARQAGDEGLWFMPVTITEDYLQRALRSLHEAFEGKSSSECARAALNPSPEASKED